MRCKLDDSQRAAHRCAHLRAPPVRQQPVGRPAAGQAEEGYQRFDGTGIDDKFFQTDGEQHEPGVTHDAPASPSRAGRPSEVPAGAPADTRCQTQQDPGAEPALGVPQIFHGRLQPSA